MTLKYIIPLTKQSESSYVPLMTIQKDLNNFFDRFFDNESVFAPTLITSVQFPCVNVVETDKEIEIKAELPGMEEKDIKLETDKNTLIIRGEKKSETEEKDKEGRHYLKEISYGSFSRVFSFPFVLDYSKANASFSKGVLTITFQKPEEEVSTRKLIPITHK